MRKKIILSLVTLIYSMMSYSQTTGFEYDFQNASTNDWSGAGIYTFTVEGDAIRIRANHTGGANWNTFMLTFPEPIDMSNNSSVLVRVRGTQNATVRFDLEDTQGRVTNASALSLGVGQTYQYHILNYTDFRQSVPTAQTVNSSSIRRLAMFVDPGQSVAAFDKSIYFDVIQVGSAVNFDLIPENSDIYLNQVGFYPSGPKVATINSRSATTFNIVNISNSQVVYTGDLNSGDIWSPASMFFKKADFTDFVTPGTYKVVIGELESHPFEIKNNVFDEANKASIKAFYFNRASIAIQSQYGGIWARPMGHPDNYVLIHGSAVGPTTQLGDFISSPKGWYDAGDYNKYIVNGGISIYTLMSLYEHYPEYYNNKTWNIPESNNQIPDLLDEVLWQLRWMMTMQDPMGGGVYHKLTNLTFDGVVMPHQAGGTRYVVKKSTAATLNFCASMAQAYRIFSSMEDVLPGLADSCLERATKAWYWALNNKNVVYSQNPNNSQVIVPNDVVTGEYGDGNFADEFFWAAAEMYIATRETHFYNAMRNASGTVNSAPNTVASGVNWINCGIPSWQSVEALGYVSLNHYKSILTDLTEDDITNIENRIMNIADDYYNGYESSAMGIPMGMYNWNFTWGSNGMASNIALMLIQGYNITSDVKYMNAALANIDYLLGRTPTGYCFLTGFGSKPVMDPHHRPSEADNNNNPVPGFLAGGPNPSRNDAGACSNNNQSYPSALPALAYIDHRCSYASNEVTINWNAPFAYATGAIQAYYSNVNRGLIIFEPTEVGLTKYVDTQKNWNLYPNPATEQYVVLESLTDRRVSKLSLSKITGEVISNLTINDNKVMLPSLNPGLYLLNVETEDQGVVVMKLNVN